MACGAGMACRGYLWFPKFDWGYSRFEPFQNLIVGDWREHVMLRLSEVVHRSYKSCCECARRYGPLVLMVSCFEM